MNTLRRLFYFTFLLKSFSVSAWEVWPEYYFVSSSEQRELDDPSKTDSEYTSDILAFSRSSHEDYLFFSAPNQILVGMGSVGSKNFMINDHLKIQQGLTDSLEFRFRYFKEKDFDQELQAQVVELNYHLSPHFSVGVYGEGTYRKSEIDFGLSLFYCPDQDHEVRLFWTSSDWVRNERNQESDSFAKAPHSFGVVGRWVSRESSEFFIYSFREEKPTHWDFPAASYRYKFHRRVASLYGRRLVGNNFVTFRWQGELKHEEKQQLPGETGFAAPEQMARERHLLLGEWERDLMRLGLFATQRYYSTGSADVSQTTLLPYIWLKAPAGKTAGIQDYWQVGLDTSLFRETGDMALTTRSHDNGVQTEYRMSTSYDFQLKQEAQLRLIFTFDLDEFGSGQTWEGGAGTFQMSF